MRRNEEEDRVCHGCVDAFTGGFSFLIVFLLPCI